MRNVAQVVPVIRTIGHSDRSIEEFVALVEAYGITLLIDVRKMPRSASNPQFNCDTLPHILKQVGISYLHLPGLGGLRRRRPDSPNGGWHNPSFQGYADYMQTPDFAENLETVLKAARHDAIALMCAEAVPWRCHRSLIGDALVARGVRVEDILSITRAQEHTLRPWAKVVGSKLIYPPARTADGNVPFHHTEACTVTQAFKVGDHVRWNSEAGWVTGVIKKKVTSEITFKGYKVHASKEEPQYLIKSDKTDHEAMHKGSALKKIRKAKR
jgi:hypothetical protein